MRSEPAVPHPLRRGHQRRGRPRRRHPSQARGHRVDGGKGGRERGEPVPAPARRAQASHHPCHQPGTHHAPEAAATAITQAACIFFENYTKLIYKQLLITIMTKKFSIHDGGITTGDVTYVYNILLMGGE